MASGESAWLIDEAKRSPVEDDYVIGRKLGAGSFSTVVEATSRETGEVVALKIISKAAVGTKTKMLVTEVSILQSVEHENVIALLGLYETAETVVLVLEVLTGGELFERVVREGNLSERTTAGVVRQLLSALDYLHERNIVHRDLKPENVLFSTDAPDAVLKIADFGLSTVVDEGSPLTTACGTPGYVAPEILQQTGYGAPADMWSVGIITYILLCGFPPFYDENLNVLFTQIMAGSFDYPEPYWAHVSPLAKQFIDALLTVSPDLRLTAADALNHPWLAPGADLSADNGSSGAYGNPEACKAAFKKAILARLAVHKFASSLAILDA